MIFMTLERKEVISLEDVLPHVKMNRKKIQQEIKGDKIKITSIRLNVFKNSNLTCPICNLQATYFAKEKNINDKSYHLNLYGLHNDREILFTRDHILPRSLGGKDTLENQQIMCEPCNLLKGNRHISNEDLKEELRQIQIQMSEV
jgi:hypothetical protein